MKLIFLFRLNRFCHNQRVTIINKVLLRLSKKKKKKSTTSTRIAKETAFNQRINGLSTRWFPFQQLGLGFKCTEHKDEFSTSVPLLLGSRPTSKFCQVILLSKCNLQKKKKKSVLSLKGIKLRKVSPKCSRVQNNAYLDCLKRDKSRMNLC